MLLSCCCRIVGSTFRIRAVSTSRTIITTARTQSLFTLKLARPLSTTTITMATTKEKITDWVATNDKSGEFKRKPSVFRSQIAPNTQFPPVAGRYHLYVSYACPWAHRTLITRRLKCLESIISVSVVHWHMGSQGWRFSTSEEAHEVTDVVIAPEPINGASLLSDIYFKAEPGYTGRYTVPTLWDKETNTIVNNESSEIIRMFYTVFDDLLPKDSPARGVTYLPQELEKQIDEQNTWVYDTVNNGVYRSGFATTQEAYESAVVALFQSLDKLEKIFADSNGPYLFGDKLTEADIRLYPTIVRFDVVYVQHFKTNLKMIRHDYPNMHRWLKHLYWEIPAFRETTNFEHIKNHYTKSHTQINPKSITPLGPVPDMVEL